MFLDRLPERSGKLLLECSVEEEIIEERLRSPGAGEVLLDTPFPLLWDPRAVSILFKRRALHAVLHKKSRSLPFQSDHQ